MENIIGKRIKEIRLSLGYSQQQFADHIKISKPMISYIESGKKTPSRETVSKIANISNISSDYIMGLSNDKQPDAIPLSEVQLDLKYYIDKIEKFDDETKDFAIKKIKALISALDLEIYK
ncbi:MULTISPECIES: helix-turn-helix domain-containing protein [Bacillus]|uniref:XRE family transcriptional regulator n=3 Tax=Bacillus thuringiensis TaxID=1428 RepID=A0A9X7AT80_BACTU|nr:MULTISPECIES: helix-turn-helix transcriptional regulator [Bacillus]AHA74810.1 XRE family transcriptional regulator [Bacillus thuringiensis YBT-1518]AOM13838.1 hypothetical protein BTI247_55020 [Bacillus thuringiensis Bt18247]MBG9486909.1 transcriptional regulator [Bacillus thuringiensis]MBG9492121.1 transcriptional regulator [Bacillus thuringiensis]MBG9501313.1 transcriptional regulator [Bacillus thuringiensis]